MRQTYYEEQPDPIATGSNFSHGKTILVLAIVVGCFAVLWPKIFYPMLFGTQVDRQEDTVAANPQHLPGGVPGPGAMPGSEFLHPAMRERGKMAGMPSMAALPEVGTRPPIRTVDKEWGGRGGPMPGMRPTMGGPGIQAQQPRGSGTMGVIMPIYTVGIIIFFVYTTMKILFKNKDNEEDEDEYTQKRRREMKYRQEEESEYSRYTQNYNNKLPKRSQEFIEKDRKKYIIDKEVSSPDERIEEINQMVNDLKQETVKQMSSKEVIPLGCTNKFLDPDTVKNTSSDPDIKRNRSSGIETIKSTPSNLDTFKSTPSNLDTLKITPLDVDPPKNTLSNQENQEAVTQSDAGLGENETELGKEEGKNISGMINQKKASEIIEKETSLDPRDLEISLLKKRLEETEKAMERIMAQMGTVTQHLLPQTLEATLLSHPTLQASCESSQHKNKNIEEMNEQYSKTQQHMENDITEINDSVDSMNENDIIDTNKEQISE